MSDLQDPRVLFAAERTLLAWNKTSLALIAFGFLVERAGLLLRVLAPEHIHPLSGMINFWVGLLFIAVGIFSALYSAQQYADVLKTLNPIEFPAGYKAKWGMMINIIVAVLGSALVVALLVKN